MSRASSPGFDQLVQPGEGVRREPHQDLVPRQRCRQRPDRAALDVHPLRERHPVRESGVEDRPGLGDVSVYQPAPVVQFRTERSAQRGIRPCRRAVGEARERGEVIEEALPLGLPGLDRCDDGRGSAEVRRSRG